MSYQLANGAVLAGLEFHPDDIKEAAGVMLTYLDLPQSLVMTSEEAQDPFALAVFHLLTKQARRQRIDGITQRLKAQYEGVK